ncbi:hypothetical protein [Cytobacillus purgationiresistens]|uniref:Uncharacterized protein n=1 Tax=Cytobacillus purgationiresistens TaxID=863449 RepID=A0ABU0AJA5_9BACI|nr:hypothetical protein [Cytobacillus purgationiresistens]MDQ0270498.1 hypothetical protein [Cytobacillus purgationiresistens]
MNIQQYYHKAAVISLNASLASLIPPFFLLVYSLMLVPPKVVIGFSIPFLIYSFISFQAYVMNQKRANEIGEMDRSEVTSADSLFQQRVMSITFLPAPSLRVLFFNSAGCVLGEIRDIHSQSYRWFLPYFIDRLSRYKHYGLYDHQNEVIAFFSMSRKKVVIQCEGKQSELLFNHKASSNHIEFMNEESGKSYYVERARMYMDYKIFINSSVEAVSLKKGWMPASWGHQIKDANIPFLTINRELSSDDQLAVFAMIAFHLRTHNH